MGMKLYIDFPNIYILIQNHPYCIEARYSLTRTVTNEIEIEKIATTTPHHTTTRVLVRDTQNKSLFNIHLSNFSPHSTVRSGPVYLLDMQKPIYIKKTASYKNEHSPHSSQLPRYMICTDCTDSPVLEKGDK